MEIRIKENEVKRHAGLDLLRIVSMIMILFLHYLSKGGLLNKENSEFSYYGIYRFIQVISIVAVNCYVIISGYFLVNSQFKWKRVFKLWGEALFYSISIYIIHQGFQPFGIKEFLKSIFPVITNQYWFINVYLVLYVLAPFINKLIHSLTKEEHKKLLIILLIVFSIHSFLPSEYTLDSSQGYGIIWFICLYLIGGYIRLYNVFLKFNATKYSLIYLACAVLITIAMLVIELLCEHINRRNLAGKLIQYNNIFVLIESVALFMTFKEMTVKNKYSIKIINTVAPLTLAVYLIHEHPLLRNILYDKILHTQVCYHNPYGILITVFSVISMFLVCIMIEKIRQITISKLKIKKESY